VFGPLERGKLNHWTTRVEVEVEVEVEVTSD
jgi:hypothetical protein